MQRLIRLALAAFAVSLFHSAHAADLTRGGTVVAVPDGPCRNGEVLRAVASGFSHQVRHVPHLPDVAIRDFQNIGVQRYEPQSEDRPIARLYCRADAMLSDGHVRRIWYLIEEGVGFASIGDNVEFCVEGFDRWYVYNSPWCRVLR
jgi:capsid protein